MLPKLDILKRLTDAGLVAVVRAETADQATRIADAVLEGGCPGIEVTFTVPGAHRVIEALAARYKPSELILGAGTVLDPETARIAILSGATYVVSPSLNPDTVRLCNRYQVPVMPGAMTIRDVIEAMEAGADIIKLFPGEAFGPGIIKAIKGPLPAGAADAHRRRGCQQRRRVDQGRGRGCRRGQQSDRRREDRRLRGDHAPRPPVHREHPGRAAKIKQARDHDASSHIRRDHDAAGDAGPPALRAGQRTGTDLRRRRGQCRRVPGKLRPGRAFVTRLPRNPFGDGAVHSLRGLGVDTSGIARGGERIGIYFLETGASQRASVVVYDRAGSAISQVGPGEFDWADIFAGATWFHFTGITPALGPRVAEATREACRAAKSAGLTVSCDLNYRKKLWTPAEAQATMTGLMEWVDVAIGNEEDAEKVFGIRAEGANITGGHVDAQAMNRSPERWPTGSICRSVAITLRESRSADNNGWSAMLLHEGQALQSRSYDINIVDRVGGGDSFAAGLIYGLATGKSGQDALEFAVAASCLKHSISGDFNLVSVAEVESLVGGDASGRVQR